MYIRNSFFIFLLFFAFKANAQYNVSYYAYGSPLSPIAGSFNAKPLNIYSPSDSTFFFYMQDSVSGVELWKGDGVNLPTMVSNIKPSGDIHEWIFKTDVKAMCAINGVLYFSANDGLKGAELWKYDGSNPPSLVADIVPGIAGSGPCFMEAMGGKLYFGAYKDSVAAIASSIDRHMFVYDPGTNAVSPVVARGNQIKFRYRLHPEGAKFIYVSNNPNDSLKIYGYEPSTGNEALYINPLPGKTVLPRNLYKWNGKYYFIAEDPVYGSELFECAATGGTAVRITDIYTGAGSSMELTSNAVGEPRYVGFGNYLYFFAKPSASSTEAYKYDPSTGSVSMQNYNVGIGNYGGVVYNNKLIFGGSQPTTRTATYNVIDPCVFNGVDSPRVIKNLLGTVGTYPIGWALSADSSRVLFAVGGDDYFNYPRKIFSLTDSTIAKDTSTSVSIVREVIEARAYPNPAKDLLNIEMKVPHTQALQVQLADNAGRVLYNSELKKYNSGSATVKINMAGYVSGLYYYRVSDQTGKTVCMGRIVH